MPPVAWIGLAELADDVAVDVGRRDVGEVLGHRPAGHGQAVAVHQAGVEQRLHDHRDAADLVDVVHHVAAERLEVAEVRHLVADRG